MLRATSMRRALGTLLVVGTAAFLFAPPASAADPGRLIESMTNEIVEIGRTRSGAGRQAAIRQVLQNNFGFPYMGPSALGPSSTPPSQPQRAHLLSAVPAPPAPTL